MKKSKLILIPNNNDFFFNKYKSVVENVTLKDNYYRLYNTDQKFMLILLRTDYEKINKEFWTKEKLEELDKALTEIYSQDKIVIAIHWGGEENNTYLNKYILPNTDANFKLNNGEGYLTFYSDSNDDISLKTHDNIYSFLIDRVEKLSLDYQKKKLINLWLPLAIDIQGLSEVENENYYNDIKKELFHNGIETEYYNSLKSFPKEGEFSRWEEIKEKLQSEYKNFNSSQLVELIYSKDYSEFSKNKANYLDKKINGRTNPNYLPNWLQKVVEVFDDKIKGGSKETTEVQK